MFKHVDLQKKDLKVGQRTVFGQIGDGWAGNVLKVGWFEMEWAICFFTCYLLFIIL